MNILCLHPVLSMRAVKEMAAVRASGHRVILAYEGIGSSASVDKGDFWDKVIGLPTSKNKIHFKARRLLPALHRSTVKRIVKEEHIDIVHVFSMPDHLAVAATKYASVPVVYDVRDLTTGMNKTPFFYTQVAALDRLQGDLHRIIEKGFERFVCKNASGIVCVTESMADKVAQLYGVCPKKITFLESYPLRDSIPRASNKKLSKDGEVHLVYIGNVLFDGHETSVAMIKQIADEGLHLHIYPTGGDHWVRMVKEAVAGNGFVHFHEPKEQKCLFAELPQYDYGLVLYSPDKDQLNRSLTISNKLLEYLSCGIPVASTDMEAPRRFLNEHNAGFVFKNCSDLAEKARKLKRDFAINQDDFVMEKHISRLLQLYGEAVRSFSRS